MNEASSTLVTLLFTDLVGSTELLSRAGDEKARLIFAAHHELLTDAVAQHGGHEVKWLGDGLMVAFPSAADAVSCAVTMQQGAQRPVAGERLQIRVGLTAGEALRDTADYFGTPVVMAKRLCDRASAGQILCSDLVAGLLSGRQGFTFAAVGELELKGLPNPVATYEVRYESDPGALFATGTPLIGRDRELARLVDRLRDMSGGRGGLVLLAGESGVGKTRLAEEAAAVAEREGAFVLWGRCFEGEWAPPYAPLAEALGPHVAVAGREELRADLGSGAAALAQLVPGIRDALVDLAEPPPVPPEEERFRLLDAMAQFLVARSRRARPPRARRPALGRPLDRGHDPPPDPLRPPGADPRPRRLSRHRARRRPPTRRSPRCGRPGGRRRARRREGARGSRRHPVVGRCRRP